MFGFIQLPSYLTHHFWFYGRKYAPKVKKCIILQESALFYKTKLLQLRQKVGL